MPAPDAILQLVQRFTDQITSYHAARYNETETRRELIDPLFRALGWDVDNSQHYAEAYKDVIHEDAIKIGGVTKAPDYAFRIGGTRKFFVEAKKPSVNVHDDFPPAFQLRRYAWTAKLPLSILTDFEEFAVYDCRQKPDKTDKPSTGRVLYLNYTDYVHRWDEIAGIFSHDAILKGSFDRYAEENRGKRGTTDVDDAFLAEIEHWRYLLAHNIALRNNLSQRELNYTVQMTVDRIIFLRICEDRGIEQYGRLQALVNGGEIYPRLVGLFRYADQRYDSGLFHFNPEKGQQDAPDELTPALQIDDKTLKEIIGGLYYPESPYEFSVMPASILGQVYEQFLGKVIRKTSENRAVVEDKPEVKKAGGVYYTPTYIVDYIVKHTVGALLDGKKPGDMGVGRGEPLRVLDPACGSGSFLLGAYQYLLDWYRDGYITDGVEKWCKGKNPTLYQSQGGGWKLTTAERKRILLEHIYGVDIDSQAVEVTKLSLLLKVLEGESEQSLQTMLDFYKERVLPNLGQNIKCGNSLIGPDFYTQGTQLAFFDMEEKYRINAFDWQGEFSQVFMHSGGFDAVIGNPPYGANFSDHEKHYLHNKYVCQNYQLDSYLLFLEKSINTLLRQFGNFGMIIPNPWLTNLTQENTRRFIVNNTRIKNIVHFKFPVFQKVVVDTEIVILQKASALNWESIVKIVHKATDLDLPEIEQVEFTRLFRQDEWINKNGGIINIFISEKETKLAQKCFQNGSPLSRFFEINVGIKPYQVGKGIPPQTKDMVKNRPFDSDMKKDETYIPCLRGSDINRYQIQPIKTKFLSYGNWLAEPRRSANFQASEKLFIRQTGDSLIATYDNKQRLCLNNMHVLVPRESYASNIFYFLGIINSRLLNWYYHTLNPEIGEALAEVKKTNVSVLPIIDSTNNDHPKNYLYIAIDKNVKILLELHNRLLNVKTPIDVNQIKRQIASTDREIDRLVYDLYGLTDDEIKIVEGDDQRP